MSTEARPMLDAVNAAIAARLAGRPVDSYSINGRSLAYTPLKDLIAIRKTLQREVAASATDGGTRNYATWGEP